MKLAEEIVITIGKEDIELRPTLRNAMRLERRPGSFRQLLADINDGSLTAAVEIIEPHADGLPFLKSRVLDALPTLTPALTAYVLACTGIDPDEPSEKASKGKSRSNPVSLGEYLTGLYRIGTGWLGWSPEITLEATPAEIAEANKGRMEMLKAIFGSGEPEKTEDKRPLSEKFKTIFAVHGTRKDAA